MKRDGRWLMTATAQTDLKLQLAIFTKVRGDPQRRPGDRPGRSVFFAAIAMRSATATEVLQSMIRKKLALGI